MSSGPERRGAFRSPWSTFAPLSARRWRLVVGAGVVAIVTTGVVDLVTGPLWSMSVFYLVPVAWATAVAGRRVGMGLAVLSAGSGLLSDVIFPARNQHRVVAAGNVGLMFVTLLAVVALVSRLRQHAIAANEAEQQSREFLAFAAHQLRSPLAGISATVDALMVGSGDRPECERLLIGLGAETARATRLMNSLLRVARLDRHEPLPLRSVDVGGIVQSEIDRVTRVHPTIIWETERGEACTTTVRCNPDAVGEAVANLLDNAGRHACARVTVAVHSLGDAIEIDVADDGPGLPPGKSAAAFQRFVTMDSHGGTGLGLPIAQGIAEAHGGTLEYRSGSFTIRLPRRSTRPGDPATRSGEEQ